MDNQKENMLREVEENLVDRGYSIGSMGAPLFAWPWQNLGSYKNLFIIGFTDYYIHHISSDNIIGYIIVLKSTILS
ncbi:hypothetical protein M8C21_023618, partial [Ambrosia artemisiifolia]